MTPEQKQAKLIDAQVQISAARLQLEGVRKMYEAALTLRDNARADTYRATIHNLVDLELDSTAIIYNILSLKQPAA